MTDNKEREAFEGAWREAYPAHESTAFMRSKNISNEDGYVSTRVNDGWKMWQARAALAAAPVTEAMPLAMPKFKRYDADGKEHPHGALVFFSDVVEAVGMLETPVAAKASEPVLYQCRTRPDWRPDGWTKWEDCTPESAGDYERTPLLHDWHYEVRRLYTDQASAESSTSVTWIAEAVRNAALDEIEDIVIDVLQDDAIAISEEAEIILSEIRALKSAPPQPATNPAATCEGSLCMQSNRCSYAPCRSGAPPQPAEQPSGKVRDALYLAAKAVRNSATNLEGFSINDAQVCVSAYLAATPALGAAQAAPVAQGLKDHEVREAINQVRDIAIAFHADQQLRARIAGVLMPILARALLAKHGAPQITEADARAMGEKGAPHSEAERLLYEAYCKGHCWAVGPWVTKKQHYYEMTDRIRFAMWRDRAALSAAPQPTPGAETEGE